MIITKESIKEYSEKELDTFLKDNKSTLVGSAVFTKNNSLVSKIVSWAESIGKPKVEFIPSHVGSIIEVHNILYIVDMKPPRAYRTLLKTFLVKTKDDYQILLRNFELKNPEMFSLNILDRVGEGYPYMSALRSILSKFPTKKSNHCSELHLRELQKQGLFKKLNPEITPLELYNVLKMYK